MPVITRVINNEQKKWYIKDKGKKTLPQWLYGKLLTARKRKKKKKINPRKFGAKSEVNFGGWRFIVFIKRNEKPKMVVSRFWLQCCDLAISI